MKYRRNQESYFCNSTGLKFNGRENTNPSEGDLEGFGSRMQADLATLRVSEIRK